MTAAEYHDVDTKARRETGNDGVCTPYEKELIRKDGRRVAILIGADLDAEGSY